MKNVTPLELVAELESTGPGAKIATLLTKTFPKVKKDCPFVGLHRLAYRMVVLGASYENAVNRQRDAEGHGEHFDAAALWNGKGERHSYFTVRHKPTGRLYFAVKPAQVEADNESGKAAVVLADEWRDGEGRLLKLEDVQPYLPAPHKNKRQEVAADVLWRTIALDSVVQVKYGETFNVVH